MSIAVLQASSVIYPDGTRVALPDLQLEAGAELALVGPSGSGKSTALHALAGLVTVRGEAICAGLDLTKATLAQLETHRAQSVGLLFQDFHLLEGYTAIENVIAALGLSGMGIRAATLEARGLLERVGLAHRTHQTGARLSTGERQRVAIARALAGQPACVLADEPTGNLDRETADGVFELMLGLARDQGMAFVLATHDESLARRCDRVLRLRLGQLIG